MLRESYRIAKKYNDASVAISPFSEKRIIYLLEKKYTICFTNNSP